MIALCELRHSGYSARMVTNGVRLAKAICSEAVLEWKMRRLDVTLDGPSSVHDARRPFVNGKGSVDDICSNVGFLVQRYASQVDFVIRCNVDLSNAPYVPELIASRAERGWAGNVSLYFALVHPWGSFVGAGKDASWFAEQEVEWRYLLRSFGFEQKSLPRRKYITCVAVNPHSRLFGPRAEIYECTAPSDRDI